MTEESSSQEQLDEEARMAKSDFEKSLLGAIILPINSILTWIAYYAMDGFIPWLITAVAFTVAGLLNIIVAVRRYDLYVAAVKRANSRTK